MKKTSAGQRLIIYSLLIFIVLNLTILLFGIATLVSDNFGYVSSSQLLFHLTVPFNQVKTDAFVSSCIRLLLLTFGGSITGTIVFSLVFYWLNRSGKIFLNYFLQGSFIVCGLLFTTAVFYFNDYVPLNCLKYFWNGNSGIIDQNFYTPEAQEIKFSGKRNCIVLLVESLENSFSLPQVVGSNLIPELHKLQQQNISFDKYIQCNGTGWTIAALVNVFFGIPQLPLHSSAEANHKNRRSFQLPSIYHYFLQGGYNCTYLQGGDMDFAGKKYLFTDLPQVNIISFDQLSKEKLYLENPSSFSWGVDDEVLFARLRTECTRLSRLKKPFFLTALTLDTHFPNGYLRPPFNLDSTSFFAEVLRRTDQRIAAFCRWVQQQDFGKNTTIIIVGDHLAMSNEFSSQLHRYQGDDRLGGPRTIYNCFINPAVSHPGSQRRLFAMFDLMPTILHAAGANWKSDKLHLGVSLFGNTPTLLEKYGIEYYEEESLKKSDKYLTMFKLK